MREIKFRAWHTNSKSMSNNPSLHYGTDYLNEEFRKAPDLNTILMQFTGLLDRHGKEIYEGDIVNENGVVRFVGGRYLIIYGNKSDEHEDLIGDEDEVCGNIYENPELLTNTPPQV